VIGTLIYTLIGLVVAPGLLKRLSNALECALQASPVGYAMAVFDDVLRHRRDLPRFNLQFAALLAGMALLADYAEPSESASPHRSTPSPKSLCVLCPSTLESSAISSCSDGSSLRDSAGISGWGRH